MKKARPFTALLPALLFFSCAGTPARVTEEPPVEFPAESAPETSPEKPRPAPPEYIMGEGKIAAAGLADFLLAANPGADRDFVRRLAGYYVEEAAVEGVNHDVAFSQMCLETGFLRYGGLVTPEMNNFCGLGATGPDHPGEVFADAAAGVRAHIQHLKGYATEEALNGELADPSYFWIKYGSSPTIAGLAGTWAADKQYAAKIGSILERLYNFSFSGG
jgi:hypothetical protein